MASSLEKLLKLLRVLFQIIISCLNSWSSLSSFFSFIFLKAKRKYNAQIIPTIITHKLIWSEKFRKVMPSLIKSRSEAINTLGGSPMAVAAPPIFEKITVAINTRTEIENKD